MMTKFLIFSFFLSWSVDLFSQSDIKKSPLRERIAINQELLTTNQEKAFFNLDELLKEAILTRDHGAELALLSNRCWYYNRKTNIEKSIESAQYLESKAKSYENIYFQARAHDYLSEAFSLNGFYDEAIAQFQKSMSLLLKENPEDQKTNYAKANSFITVSKSYTYKRNFRAAVNYLKLAESEISQIQDSHIKERMQFLNFANLASAYVPINIDSAQYYLHKSLSLKESGDEIGMTMFLNHLTLGEIFKGKKEFSLAVSNYKHAEQLAPQSSVLDMESVYNGLIEIYETTSNTEEAEDYKQKLRDIQLEIANNKNKSLHKIIEKKLLQEKDNSSTYIFLGSIIIIGLLLLLYYFRRKNKILIKQEEASQEYLQEKNILLNSDLVEMARSNDPTFLTSFHGVYPKFTENLLKINPNLAQTEIEFCAFLKLNLSSKEIARIKSIQPRTVQNKKHRIRKRLNIPENIDIYHWFNNKK